MTPSSAVSAFKIMGGPMRVVSLVAFTQNVRAVSRLGNFCFGTEAALDKWNRIPGADVLRRILMRGSERPIPSRTICRVLPSARSPKVVIQFGSDVSRVQSERSREP